MFVDHRALLQQAAKPLTGDSTCVMPAAAHAANRHTIKHLVPYARPVNTRRPGDMHHCIYCAMSASNMSTVGWWQATSDNIDICRQGGPMSVRRGAGFDVAFAVKRKCTCTSASIIEPILSERHADESRQIENPHASIVRKSQLSGQSSS